MSRTQIDLGDITCNTGTPINGVLWTCGWPEGWSGPDQRGGTLEPTGRDGADGLASFWSARVLVIKGSCAAGTEANAWAAYNLITSGLPGLRGEMDVVVHEADGVSKSVTVVQHATPQADPRGINSGKKFQWQITVRADNPLKTATTASTQTIAASGTQTLTNNGTIPAFPVITTTTSGTVDIVIGGRHFTTDSVPTGTVIDMWARTITDPAGVTVSPWPKHSSTEWLALPPGGNSTNQAGTAGLAFAWHDTYA